jgi:two-component system, chemotaxis family, protein-glutamate methylesterase/glutaminase
MNPHRKISVLVIDDSLFMRQMIVDILEADAEIGAVESARDAQEGLAKLVKMKPDVITLDYQMPGLNGIAVLKKIMRHEPTPVVLVSAYTPEGGVVTLEALREGAIDFVLKPSGSVSLDLRSIGDEIIKKVKAAASISKEKLRNFLAKEAEEAHFKKTPLPSARIVAIGSSTGGTKGVEMVIAALPKEFPAPILIVQHMPEIFTALFANRLNSVAEIVVKEGVNHEDIKNGVGYVAPGGWHMIASVKQRPLIRLTKNEPVYGLRPSVDVLMKSVAEQYREKTIGVILSGMGNDGTEGMEAIFKAKGTTIAQDEATSIIFGMPKRAIEAGVVNEILPIEKIASRIVELVSE